VTYFMDIADYGNVVGEPNEILQDSLVVFRSEVRKWRL